jgi:hypothetical protein
MLLPDHPYDGFTLFHLVSLCFTLFHYFIHCILSGSLLLVVLNVNHFPHLSGSAAAAGGVLGVLP